MNLITLLGDTQVFSTFGGHFIVIYAPRCSDTSSVVWAVALAVVASLVAHEAPA